MPKKKNPSINGEARKTVDRQSDESTVEVQQPVIDKIAFVLPWKVHMPAYRDERGETVEERKKKIVERLQEAVSEGLCTFVPASSNYRQKTLWKVDEQEVLVQVISRNEKAKGDVRIELNPCKIEKKEIWQLYKKIGGVLQLNKGEFGSLLERVSIRRLDLAVDVVGVELENLLIGYKGIHEYTMFSKRLKKNRIETMNFGSVTSDYQYAVYDKRTERVHNAIGKLLEGRAVEDRLKESLIRRVHEARDLPPTIRVEVRARRMGAHPSELAARGANRFERFRFSEVQCLDEVGPTLRRAFLAEVRDVGLAAALERYDGTKHYRKLKKALEVQASWWEPQGLWAQAIESLKGAGLFPASAFDEPED